MLNATTEDYVVAIDIDTGCAHFAVSLFADGAAPPPLQADPGAVAAASATFVTPIPVFLAEVLRKRRQENPDANTLGRLLPTSTLLDSRTLTLKQAARISPSYARFCNTLGPYAVTLKLDRYVAAILIHDPRLTPSGKFFYARATREELWDAADPLFNGMGWGSPIPFVDGLAAGSQVTPTRATIQGWVGWMKGQVEAARPGESPTRDLHHEMVTLLVAPHACHMS